jgi:hypothetical protein
LESRCHELLSVIPCQKELELVQIIEQHCFLADSQFFILCIQVALYNTAVSLHRMNDREPVDELKSGFRLKTLKMLINHQGIECLTTHLLLLFLLEIDLNPKIH